MSLIGFIGAYLAIGGLACFWTCVDSRHLVRLLLMEFLFNVSNQMAEKKVWMKPSDWRKMVLGFRWGMYSVIFLTNMVIWPYKLYLDVRKAFKKEEGTPS